MLEAVLLSPEDQNNASANEAIKIDIVSSSPIDYKTLNIYCNNIKCDNVLFEWGPNNESVTATLEYNLFPSTNIEKRYYSILLEASNEEEEIKKTFLLKMIDGIYYRFGYEDDIFYSSRTQQVANLFPYNSKLRTDPSSVGQQILAPSSLELDNLFKDIYQQDRNRFLQTYNNEFISRMFVVNLSDGAFKKHFVANSGDYYSLPIVYGFSDITKINIQSTKSNLIDDFRNVVPDRLVGKLLTDVYIPEILIDEYSDNFTFNVNRVLSKESPLWIKIEDENSFIFEINNSRKFFSVKIEGVDFLGNTKTEVVPFPSNKTLRTISRFEEIKSVSVQAKEDTESKITIESFKPKMLPIEDTNFGSGNAEFFGPCIWSIGEKDNKTYLEEHTYKSYSVVNELNGFDTTESIRKTYLTDIDGNDIQVTDFCVDRFKDFIYVCDQEKLRIYDKKQLYPEKVKELYGQSPNPSIIFDIVQYYEDIDVSGEVKIEFKQRLFDKLISKTRFSVLKPDGSIDYINAAGDIVEENLSWLMNGSFQNTIFTIPELTYNLSGPGSYIFVLEMHLQNKEVHVVKTLLSVEQRKPKIEYKLSEIPGVSEEIVSPRIMMDDNNQLFLLDNYSLWQIDFLYDRMLIDYNAKQIYFKEQYQKVYIDES